MERMMRNSSAISASRAICRAVCAGHGMSAGEQATFGGAVVVILAAAAGLSGKSWEQDIKREPPVPPGTGGTPFGGF